MNDSFSGVEGYLHVLHRGLVLIRFACQGGETAKAEAIADALHNLPMDLLHRQRLDKFKLHYIDPLVAKYPELDELVELLP